MRDLHSTGSANCHHRITSHNECLQVMKSSAIAKHRTEWLDILWKDSHTPGNTTKLRLYWLFKTTYAIQPYLVIVANSQLRKSLCKFRIGCHQLKIETETRIYQSPSATTNWKTLQTVHSWLCGERDPFLNWMPKVHTFERSITQRSNYNRSWLHPTTTVPEIYILDELRLIQDHTQCFTLHKPSWTNSQ